MDTVWNRWPHCTGWLGKSTEVYTSLPPTEENIKSKQAISLTGELLTLGLIVIVTTVSRRQHCFLSVQAGETHGNSHCWFQVVPCARAIWLPHWWCGWWKHLEAEWEGLGPSPDPVSHQMILIKASAQRVLNLWQELCKNGWYASCHSSPSASLPNRNYYYPQSSEVS